MSKSRTNYKKQCSEERAEEEKKDWKNVEPVIINKVVKKARNIGKKESQLQETAF